MQLETAVLMPAIDNHFLRIQGICAHEYLCPSLTGPLPSPENVTLSSQNSSSRQLQWNPPYYSVNQGSDIVDVDPHITQYTVYIVDAYTWKMIGNELNRTETNFTLRNNISDHDLCPMYQVSAWNAGGEGELSELVYESAPQGK